MKKVTCSARVIRVTPVFAPDGSPLYRRGRLITHRVILAPSSSFEEAIKACATLKRLTPEEAAKADRQFSERPASFCLKRNDGLYAIDLNANQLTLATGGRMPAALFQFVAPHATLNLSVELRNIGDIVIDRMGKELPVQQGHAAIQDLSATFPPHIEMQLLGAIANATMSAPAGFGTAPAPVGTVAAESPLDEMDDITHPATSTSKDNSEVVQIGATPAAGEQSAANVSNKAEVES